MFGTNEIVGKKHFKAAPANSLFVTSVFFTLQGEGPYSGLPSIFVRLAKCNLNCSFCFPSHYKVTVRGQGKVRSDKVQVGDEIHTLDANNQRVFTKVKETNTRWVPLKYMVELEYRDGFAVKRMVVTQDHPFHVQGVGFVEAGKLQTGQRLVRAESKRVHEHSRTGATVISVNPATARRCAAPFQRYGVYQDGMVKVTNFTCEGDNTFCMNDIHTHNCDTFFDSGDWLTFEQLNNKIKMAILDYFEDQKMDVPSWALKFDVANQSFHHDGVVLIITGGEPLLQDALVPFLQQSEGRYAAMQIESNGTIDQPLPKAVTLVCSPKCSEKAKRYLTPSDWILDRADCLKFVVSADPDSPYNTIPQWAHEWKQRTGKHVYVSPMNIYNTLPQRIKEAHSVGPLTMEQRSKVDEVISFWAPGVLNMEKNQLNHEYAARYAISHGLRFQLQTHLFASLA